MSIIQSGIRNRKGGGSRPREARAVDPSGEVFGFGEIFGTRPKIHLTDEQRAQRFWMGMIYGQLAGYWVIGVVGFTYAFLTWGQPHRYLIAATAVAALIIASACYGLRYQVVAVSWRLWFFGALNFWAFASLAFVCVLDGGVNSVLTFFLLLPMIYLASGYPLNTVLICGGLGILNYGILVANTSAPLPVTPLFLQVAGLSVGWLLALIGAANRQRQDQEARYLRRHLEVLAITDDLTGCLNRRAFVEAVDQEIKRVSRYAHKFALLTMDIDHFKQINDNHGHLIGDEVLRQIGLRLRQAARDTDVAGRQGGDELALLAPETGLDEARALAQRLQHDLKALEVPVEITLSIGICVSSPDSGSAATLFRRADQALYEAKRRGRNQTVVCGE